MAIETINPSTGERVCAFPALTDREIDEPARYGGINLSFKLP